MQTAAAAAAAAADTSTSTSTAAAAAAAAPTAVKMSDVFIYSSVSKCMPTGPLVLAKYAVKTGDFPQVIARILEKLSPDDNEAMYEYSG